ncbi:MAG: DNA primase noncatalytic subunit PriX [Desulfurococcales archaeon]|nr:DNA primase noncatalytic subunit PriX [Desulfurococcales archaeon]
MTDQNTLIEFYEKWLSTHLKLNWFVEIGHSSIDNQGFVRNLYSLPDTGAAMIMDLRKKRNVMASLARYPEPVADHGEARYPLVSLDFDCPNSPWNALREASRIARALKNDYGVDAVIVRSGFKGAHLHIPLKGLATHQELRAIGYGLKKVFEPRACNGKSMLDPSTLEDYRHLLRVPYTYNIKKEGRRFTVVLNLNLNKINPNEFEWGSPLDPKELGLVFIEPKLPVIRVRKPVLNANAWSWVEYVLRIGLPDGRKRFIFYVASRYLVNIKGLSLTDALRVIEEFLEASCVNHGNCSKVYSSWIKSVLRGVKEKELKPKGLGKLGIKHPDILELIQDIGVFKARPKYTAPNPRIPEPILSFLRESGLKEFSYQDFKEWLESKRERVTAAEWSRYTRMIRFLAETCFLGRKFKINGEWIDFGCGPLEKPPSRRVLFYYIQTH